MSKRDDEHWFETSGKSYMSWGSSTETKSWKGLVFVLLNGGWIAGSVYYCHEYSNAGKEAEAAFFGFLTFLGVLVFFITMAARSRQRDKSGK